MTPPTVVRAEDAILDSHCHAWSRWPYLPPVPDAETRGSVELLLYELDKHGVAEAAVVCASIDGNPDNVEYAARARDDHPGRLHLIADLDCHWSTTYHLPGSADRLRALDDRYRLTGFTHYLEESNDGWLRTADADALLTLAADRRLIVSLGATPAWQADLRALASRHPSVPILCHALGVLRAADGVASEAMGELLASAATPNIYVKVCGLHYASGRSWNYPWPDALELLERVADAYGPGRLCWGSDFPAATRYCTFRQSLEVVREHCSFLDAAGMRLVLGGTFASILDANRPDRQA